MTDTTNTMTSDLPKISRRISLKPDEKMMKRLDRFDEIVPGLFLSSVKGCSDPSNIKYNYIEIKDEPTENLKQYLDNIVEFIDQSLTIGGKVALHCRHSVSRTTSAAIAYLIYKKGMSYD